MLLQHQKWCHGDTSFIATITLYLISINSNNKSNFIANYGFYKDNKLVIIQHTFKIDNNTAAIIHKSQWYDIFFTIDIFKLRIKCAATFALLGDVDFTRNGDVAIWCILNTTSTTEQPTVPHN